MTVIKATERTGVRSSDVRAREQAARLAHREERATRRIATVQRPDGARLLVDVEHASRGPRVVLTTASGVELRTRGAMCIYPTELDALEEAIRVAREWAEGGDA